MKKVSQISLFDKNDSYWDIRKHSSIVQMSNLSTLLQRKIMDVSMWVSKDQLKRDINQRKFGCELGLFKRLVGFKDGNNEDLKQSFRQIRSTQYEYNIFHKHGEDWGNMSYFSDVQIITGGRGRPSYVYRRFPERVLEVVKNPKMYVILNLLILLGLDSKHSYVLYSFLKDYVRLGRFNFSYPGLRHLFGIQQNQYYSFSMFQKRVLDIAVNEINEKTDLTASYEIERVGRKILSISFAMKLKKKGLGIISTDKEITEKLKALGIQEKQIIQLIKNHDEQYILANIKVVEDRIKEGGNIKNMPAYLMSAFEKDFRPTETEHSRNQKKKLAMAAEKEQHEKEKEEEIDNRKAEFKDKRNTRFNEMLDAFSEDEHSELRAEFEEMILETEFPARIYKAKGFEFGAIQVERRKFLIEKFLPSHLHSFENYASNNGQEDNLSNQELS